MLEGCELKRNRPPPHIVWFPLFPPDGQLHLNRQDIFPPEVAYSCAYMCKSVLHISHFPGCVTHLKCEHNNIRLAAIESVNFLGKVTEDMTALERKLAVDPNHSSLIADLYFSLVEVLGAQALAFSTTSMTITMTTANLS